MTSTIALRAFRVEEIVTAIVTNLTALGPESTIALAKPAGLSKLQL